MKNIRIKIEEVKTRLYKIVVLDKQNIDTPAYAELEKAYYLISKALDMDINKNYDK